MDRAECLRQVEACNRLGMARSLHARAASEYPHDTFLLNKVVEMFGRCSSARDSRRVFDGMHHRDSFSWVFLLLAYANNRHLEETREVFDNMPLRTLASFTVLLKLHGESGRIESAVEIYTEMPEWDIISSTAMLGVYAQSGQLAPAVHLFRNMPERNLLSLTTMLSAYSQARRIEQAEDLFYGMPERDLPCWNSMLAAYAENGDWSRSEKLFAAMPARNVVSWTCILSGLVHKRRAEEAIHLFRTMNLTESPDETCCLAVLSACGDVGGVEEARQAFLSMKTDHNLEPAHPHFCCMVDILARLGRVAEASDVITGMPFASGALEWRSLLGACKGRAEAEFGARKVMELGTGSSSSNLVLVANRVVSAFGYDEQESGPACQRDKSSVPHED